MPANDWVGFYWSSKSNSLFANPQGNLRMQIEPLKFSGRRTAGHFSTASRVACVISN